jgi:dTDP-3-amino-3,4,6-trideoxy-alpha-D-glucose transaminase
MTSVLRPAGSPSAERASDEVPFLDLGALNASIAPQLHEAVRRVIADNHLVRGPECEAFESEFARFCGTEHAIGVGNGLDALTLGLRALGVGAGDEVIVPGQTFIATWLAVSAVGAIPVAADVDPHTGQLDPAAAAAAITRRTAAIIAVHLFGAPAPMAQLQAVAFAAGVFLIEDAAQAHGLEFAGHVGLAGVGELSDYAAFSFYPGKNLGALGDGGMVVTNRADVADRVRVISNYGSRVKYQHDELGVNSRLDELQAAVLRVKLPFLESWNDQRRQLAARYHVGLSELAGIELLQVLPDSRPVFHLYPVRLVERDRVAAELTAAGIGVGIHYPVTPGNAAAYTSAQAPATRPAQLPNSERWARHELSLPIGPTMSLAQADRVMEVLAAAL